MGDKSFKINIKTFFDKTGLTGLISGLNKGVKGVKGVKGAKAFGAALRKAMNSAPVRLLRKSILGVAAALAGSVVEGARFNVQMARVWTMAGGGINNFKALRKEARGLSADFGKSGAEMAQGMYNALSAGVDRSNLESFMRSAAQVAVADGSDISVAVDGITTVLNAFGIESAKTEQVTDQLFQTVKMGKTSFGELAASLSNTASVAAATGIPLEQILAHIATLTAQGTPAAQATTQIRQSIIGLNKALGDGWSKSMSFQDALKKVWEKSGKSQTALLKLVGSTEAVQAVLGGVGEKAAMAAKKLDSMKDSAGAAKKAFDQVNQFRHWPTLLETARAALAKFGAEIDVRIRPAVVAVTQQIREWTKSEGLWNRIGKTIDAAVARMTVAKDDFIAGLNKVRAAFAAAKEAGAVVKENLMTGGDGFGKIIRSTLVNVVDSMVKALIAAVKASLEVWKLIGRIIAAGLKEELMKLDIPGMKGFRRKAALKALPGVSDEQAREILEKSGAVDKDLLKHAPDDFVKGMLEKVLRRGELGIEGEAMLAASQDGKATALALEKFTAGMNATNSTFKKELSDNLENLETAINRATGKDVDFKGAYNRNLDRLSAPRKPAATPSGQLAAEEAVRWGQEWEGKRRVTSTLGCRTKKFH